MHTQGTTFWLTGLSGAGKSTIATCLSARLKARGLAHELLDGDVVRTHLSKGLGFSREDRDTNIRRIGWVAAVLNRHGVHAIVAAISPFRGVREEMRANLRQFVEVHCDCPLSVLQTRDPKGLYRRALAGEIKQFTGVSDPYEPPTDPEVHLHTDRGSPEAYADNILEAAKRRAYLPL